MEFPVTAIFACVALQAIIWISRKVQTRQRGLKAAAEAQCEKISEVKSRFGALGLDNFVLLRKASAQGRLSEAHRVLHVTYGPTFELSMLGQSSIQTAHAENIKTVCASSFDDWGVGPRRGGIGKPFIDRGIFTDDGAFWGHSKSLIKPTFSRAEIANLTNLEMHFQRLLQLIPSDGSTFDLLPLTKRLFLDVSTEFIFGKSVDSLLPETPFETESFMKAFDRSLLGLALLLIFRPLHWPLYLDPWWRAAAVKVHKFVDKRVAETLHQQKQKHTPNAEQEAPAQGKGPSTDHRSEPVRERYILIEGMARVTKDAYDLRMQLINIFFPARDTAAIAFSNIIFFLARHPNAWEDIRQEVLGLEIPKGDVSQLNYETVRSVKAIRAVINESLRLRPVASRIQRTALRDTVLPKGGGANGEAPIFVHAGTDLEIDIYSLQRDPTIWGDDANLFRPERWAPGRPLWESRWEYEPFLGGMRMCPAQNQVITQLSYLLVRFAQEFTTLENRDPVLEYVEEIAMTVASKNGVKIALEKA